MKRVFDCFAALVALVGLAPLMLVVAVAIRLETPGPVFFKQDRIGLGGRRFRLWKFRTMVSGGLTNGPLLTERADRRVTKVGRLLRRYKLDELPQLINVLGGEMSLVGPRPELPELVDQYTEEERLVLTVRPGVTGPSQLTWRDEEEQYPPGVDVVRYYIDYLMRPKLQSDLAYVGNRSFWGDVIILGRTLYALLPFARLGMASRSSKSRVR